MAHIAASKDCAFRLKETHGLIRDSSPCVAAVALHPTLARAPRFIVGTAAHLGQHRQHKVMGSVVVDMDKCFKLLPSLLRRRVVRSLAADRL